MTHDQQPLKRGLLEVMTYEGTGPYVWAFLVVL